MEIIILIITNILAPVITGFATWLMAKRKYNSEVDNTVIENMKNSLEFYRQLSDDNRERLSRVLEKNEQLEKEVSDLKSQVLNLAMNICIDLTCKRRIFND
jgi:regulatory protein YycI of two-component signal transduction system YycFG